MSDVLDQYGEPVVRPEPKAERHKFGEFKLPVDAHIRFAGLEADDDDEVDVGSYGSGRKGDAKTRVRGG